MQQRRKFGRQLAAALQELVAEVNQLARKTLQRRFIGCPLFEQRIAGAERMRVALQQRQIGRVRLRKQQIEKAPSHARRAFDQLEVLRAEHHGSQHGKVFSQFTDRAGVQAQFPFGRGPIHFDYAHTLGHDAGAEEIALLPVPDHLRAANAAKRPQGGQQVNRLQEVRLALRVIAQQQMETGRESHIQPRAVAEIAKS